MNWQARAQLRHRIHHAAGQRAGTVCDARQRQEDAEAVCAVSADTQGIARGDPRGRRLRHVACIPERHRQSTAQR